MTHFPFATGEGHHLAQIKTVEEACDLGLFPLFEDEAFVYDQFGYVRRPAWATATYEE